jgi:NADPH-dependent 2,4-dienoyl-CoA reductase/sulfur reductase-like enzyme
MQQTPEQVLVVGGGAAGVMTVQGLRRRGYDGPIAVIADEPAHRYDRPPLSKQVLSGAWEPSRAVLMPARRIEELGADWRVGGSAVALDTDARTVHTDDGRRHEYGELVIATGVRPRTLPWRSDRVHTLRTMDDAQGLQAALAGARRLVVVGGGFLGLEVAATARTLGHEVTVVEPLEDPLGARLTTPVSERLLRLHRERGVVIRTGVGVADLIDDRVQLSDGETIGADVVLLSIGCEPCVEWLAGTSIAIDDGVLCDEFCSAAPHVWAAGDVARWYHRGLGRNLRIEHRLNANEQGAAVAANILGAEEAFSPIPFFWTDHYGVKVQVWGVLPPDVTPELAEGDLDGERFVLTCTDPSTGAVLGAVGWNSAKSMAAHRERIAETWSQG